MNRKTMIITSSILILIAIITGLFFLFFESYKTTIDTGWSQKAYQNRFLAAEKFLSTNNKTINIAHGFSELENLEDIDTLIITNYSGVVSEKQEDVLLTWLSNGGNMVLALPHYDFDGQYSKLISETGITPYQIEIEAEETDTVTEESNTETSDSLDYLTTLSFDNIKDDLAINFDRRSSLDHESFYYEDDEKYEGYKPFYWSGDEHGIYFLQFNIDDGLLTVLSDAGIWQNLYIGDHDHAHLLFLLTESQNNIQFLIGSEFPDLMSLIWKNAYELLISSFFLLIFWLFYRGKRFLPALETSTTVRRSLNEHIEAVGKFHWKQKQTQRLLSSLREDVLKKQQLTSQATNNSQQKIIESLVLLSNIDATSLEKALFSSEITTETEFIQVVQTLKTINSKL